MAGSPSDLSWERKKVLIIGRASPEPSKKHIETVCTGGITEDGQLLRLYPIPYRYLESEEQYRLWTWAGFDVQKNSSDKRKESYRVRDGSIEIIAQVEDKGEQFSLLQKGLFEHREELDRRYHEDWTSMGIVEVEFAGFEAKKQRKDWERDKPYVKQFHMYTEIKPLQPIPFEMRLNYRCKNNKACKGHSSALLGWEYMAAFSNFKARYGTGELALEHISRAVFDRFAAPNLRTFVLVGTHFKFGSWMVAQIYWFDRATPPRLF